MALDSRAAFARAARAYELGRARRAATLAAPLVAIAVIGCCLGAQPVTSACVGIALVAAAWVFLWRGQALGKAVFPGVVAGLVPLALAVFARSYGHVCTGTECVSLCIPACTLGGLLAGLVVARTARHTASPGQFLLGSTSLAVLVGALGCSCVGFGGILGLGAGLMVTVLPASMTLRPVR